jgi:hypothetical protein
VFSSQKSIYSFFVQAVPNILGLLINFVSSNEEEWKGYFYMIILVAINLLKTVLTSQYFYQLMIVGLRIRSALTPALFKKALILGPTSRKNLTGKSKINYKTLESYNATEVTSRLEHFSVTEFVFLRPQRSQEDIYPYHFKIGRPSPHNKSSKRL